MMSSSSQRTSRRRRTEAAARAAGALALAALTLAALAAAAPAAAQTKLLRFPDVSGDRVAFCYGGDIWTAPAAGSSISTRYGAGPGPSRRQNEAGRNSRARTSSAEAVCRAPNQIARPRARSNQRLAATLPSTMPPSTTVSVMV